VLDLPLHYLFGAVGSNHFGKPIEPAATGDQAGLSIAGDRQMTGTQIRQLKDKMGLRYLSELAPHLGVSRDTLYGWLCKKGPINPKQHTADEFKSLWKIYFPGREM
jgi:hypothetical protein